MQENIKCRYRIPRIVGTNNFELLLHFEYPGLLFTGIYNVIRILAQNICITHFSFNILYIIWSVVIYLLMAILGDGEKGFLWHCIADFVVVALKCFKSSNVDVNNSNQSTVLK